MKKLLLTLASALILALPAWAAIDINNATQTELEQINGIGPKKAQAIIDYRKQHGAFKTVNDLEKVPGIGPATMERIRKDITVGNPRAAAAGKTTERKQTREGAAEKIAKDKSGRP